jgi:phosphoenolpyruvate-protein kinase (PTS system EI component)
LEHGILVECFAELLECGILYLPDTLLAEAPRASDDNPFVSNYFVSSHPAVLRLIRAVVEEAGTMPVSLCGELASTEEALPDLLRAGLHAFTVSPHQVPFVKQAIRELRHD